MRQRLQKRKQEHPQEQQRMQVLILRDLMQWAAVAAVSIAMAAAVVV